MENQDFSNFITIIDYIGRMENGVGIILSMKVEEDIYQLIYWFDSDDNYYLSADANFLKEYQLKALTDYKNYKKLAYYIHTFVLNNKEEIFNEFIGKD